MKDLLAIVDKIYCINLDSREDRWKQVTQQFDTQGISEHVVRVAAVVDRDPRKGCLMSHLHCYQDALTHGYNNILIFEDDVYFVDYDMDIFNGVVDHLNKDERWDLLYLGGNVMYPATFVHKYIFRSRFFSTHAYVVNRRFFEKACSATVPIDKWYAWNSVSYGLYPMFATQAETYSDIRKKDMGNLEEAFLRKYELLVKPNYFVRWYNYLVSHYFKN